MVARLQGQTYIGQGGVRRRLVGRASKLVPSESERRAVSQFYMDSALTADKSRVELARQDAPDAPAFSRESFFETWLQQISAWRCDKERNVLMRMIYMTLEERGVLECGFPGPAEEDFPQDPEYDFSDRPSPFFARGGVCDIILQRAEGRRISPERFMEKTFGDSISADQVFYALFGETPPDTKGLVFPKKSDVEHT